MADELSAPLLKRSDRRRAAVSRMRGFPVARLSFVLIVLIVGGVVLRLLLVDDPEGGRPFAEVAINSTSSENPIVGEVGSPVTITADPESASTSAELPIPATGDANGMAATALVEPDAAGIVPELAEEAEDGPIPRISESGQTPFAAYSRASVTPADSGGKPLVAIVVTGLGLNEAGTLDAIARLPDAVTLAFAPYGRTLDVTTAAARAEGHELFLEVPLEPFDYPDNDPGPETLLTGQPPRANIEKLYWLMARFGGYAGLINNMGARFTASGGDFSPVMEELGARGLGYLDDGSSNRSVAPQLAEANGVPFYRADMALDTNPARAPILAALAALEAKAAENGAALGIVTALPVSVHTIAEWARGLEERGIVLVPASALMAAR